MAAAGSIARILEAQRGHLFPWVPVAMAIGIGVYFRLRFEPGLSFYVGVAVFGVLAIACARLLHHSLRPPIIFLTATALGFLLVGARAHLVDAPILGFRYYGPIEGRIIGIDRSHSDKVRLTLDRVYLADMPPEKIPDTVRVSLHGNQDWLDPEPGLTVMMTGHLSPPQGPVEPGGFDFRRMAFFRGLGAVGYTRTPVLVAMGVEEGRTGLLVHRVRRDISESVTSQMPGRAGAFAAAVTTGDRSAMDRDTIEALRASNLAHLLAISGLHMGLLTGFIFAALRFGLCLIPPLALRLPVKKIGALGSLVAGFGYYLLSGGNVATERAFIMVSVMFVAVLLDRRAITLRAVAIAAIFVLVFRPETLTEPGFQMSFAATTALVAVFGALREWEGMALPKLLAPVAALVISSAVAGLATAPFAAAHFNRIAEYGLLANLLAVPVMGVIVMPGAVLAAVLAPLGLEWVGLWVMGAGVTWILAVADWVSGLQGAVIPVIAAPPIVLPLLSIGAIFLILWRGRLRVVGVAPLAVALFLWSQAERPDVLISESGKLVGIMTENGRSLSKAKGDGFTALNWLENDGDGADQFEAAARSGGLTGGALKFGISTVVHLSGRGAKDKIVPACSSADLIIYPGVLEQPPPCNVVDQVVLRKSGAAALYQRNGALEFIGAKELVGHRLWSGSHR